MKQSLDEIRIEGLQVYANHGVYQEETRLGQVFFVNAVLYTETRRAGREDNLECSTHYGEVCHFITKWMKEHTCKLIEAVAERLAEAVLLTFPMVQRLCLEIEKPQAPIGLPFDKVSVKIERGWHEAYVAFGSNMGDRLAFLEAGIQALKEHPLIRIKKISSVIRTAPYGGVEQEDFLNGCLLLRTLLSPHELLELLHRIEQAAGRERIVRWGPRTLDLDIIFYDKEIYEDEELILPHVDMQNREFVLRPMAEIAPNFRHPVLQRTMSELLRSLEERSAGRR